MPATRQLLERGLLLAIGATIAGSSATVAFADAPRQIAGDSAASASGCDRPLASGNHTIQLTFDGVSRPFALYMPRGYDGRTPIPLLLDLHGSASNGPQQLTDSEIQPVADADTFAVAAPDGGLKTVVPGGLEWAVPGSPDTGLVLPHPGYHPDDTGYLMQVIDDVQGLICQDHAKVFSTGWSGGARMSSALGCLESSRITAIFPDAGLRAGPPAGGTAPPAPQSCQPSRQVSVITIHGTSDPLNPYNGGGLNAGWGYSVATAMARWAAIDGCSQTEQQDALGPKLTLLSYPHCAGRKVVELYRVTGGGHRWFNLADPAGDLELDAYNLAFGPDPHVVSFAQVIGTAIHRLAIQAPTITLHRKPSHGCIQKRLSLAVATRFDSPPAAITLTAGTRTLSQTTSPSFRVRLTRRQLASTRRITVTATDQAGLNSTRALNIDLCKGNS